MSPADTLDNESQGSSPDMVYEEIPIRGDLKLKEVDGKILYSLTFSQVLLPHFRGQKQSDRSDISRSTRSAGSAPLGQGRGRYTDKEKELLKRLKEEDRLSWDEIAERIPEHTKGSLQVHYSTMLKDRLDTPETSKHNRKHQRAR
jgi:hypothetical protein